MDTNLEVKGMIGVEVETTPEDKEEMVVKQPEVVVQTEVKTMEDFPKTNDQETSYFSFMGVLIVLGVTLNYLNKKRNML